ncbi:MULTISPECIES: hypothetical protein [Falsihalocynthiibacter]|uniref:hypothetical protein n=1 Tax=Falsihalocynthiibacter TaxID=2854182 RepID=UPI0030024564
MRALAILFSALLAVTGCDSPHPRTKGFDVKKVSVEGSDFTVRSNGEVVEAIRTNYAPRRDFGRVLLRAVVAIEVATGCVVDQTTVKGDPALVAARIDC